MDKAYENNKTIALTKAHDFYAVVPPKKIVNPLGYRLYDKQLYKQRNIIERYFLRLKRFRKVFTRCDKLDSIFIFTISFVFVFDSLFMLL